MKKGVIITFILLLFLILFYLFYPTFYPILFNPAKICNDGTLNNTCSGMQPYFCSAGILIENASACGCNNISTANGDNCISNFQSGPKDITLNYTLRGEKGQINFTVYKELYDYDFGLPRSINSNQNPSLLDFKLKFIDEPNQRDLLLPLVVQIENLAKSKEDQMRIAVSLVQNIPFGSSNKTIVIGNSKIDYQRYPYEVLYDLQGICSEKSELLIFLLREIGYGTSDVYYSAENHEAVGVKCPLENSLDNSGYCFVETTGPSIITDDKNEYVGLRGLTSVPEMFITSNGISLGKDLYEYGDSKTLINIRKSIEQQGTINPIQYFQYNSLKGKYGLVTFNNSYSF